MCTNKYTVVIAGLVVVVAVTTVELVVWSRVLSALLSLMTSYDLLVTSPTCRQLGIQHVNITQQQQQPTTTRTTSRSSTRSVHKDGNAQLTIYSSQSVTSDADNDADNTARLRYR